MKQERTGSAG